MEQQQTTTTNDPYPVGTLLVFTNAGTIHLITGECEKNIDELFKRHIHIFVITSSRSSQLVQIEVNDYVDIIKYSKFKVFKPPPAPATSSE